MGGAGEGRPRLKPCPRWGYPEWRDGVRSRESGTGGERRGRRGATEAEMAEMAEMAVFAETERWERWERWGWR